MGSDYQGVPVRGNPEDTSTGEFLINLAMGMIREVKEDIKGVRVQLEDIAKERRDEAREHGGLEVRVSTLESAHKGTRRVAYGVAVSIIVAAIGMFIRMIALNPTILGR